jgi:hypothetical protein
MRRLVSPLDAAQLAPPAARNFRRLVYLRIVEQREVCDLDAGRSLLFRSFRDGSRDRSDGQLRELHRLGLEHLLRRFARPLH